MGAGRRTSNGENCGQYSSSSSNNQQWSRESTGGYYKFRNRATGLYLDGMGRTSNGSDLGQWSSSSSYNQQFQLISTSSIDVEEGTNAATALLFTVYPNPADKYLHIALPDAFVEGAEMMIYNNVGKLVMSKNIRGNLYTLDIKDIVPGSYIIKISNGHEIIT